MEPQETLRSSAEQLERAARDHRRLLDQALVEGGGAQMAFCPLLECPHERRLRAALLDAIRAIEETRKAFKSRTLEELRRRLLAVLAGN